MKSVPSLTPTPETVDNHKKYGSLKLQAGLGTGIAIAFFGAAYAAEGWNLLQLMGGAASTFIAAGRNSKANEISAGVEQQVLTAYTKIHFGKARQSSVHQDNNLSAEGRPLKDVTPREQRAPA